MHVSLPAVERNSFTTPDPHKLLVTTVHRETIKIMTLSTC